MYLNVLDYSGGALEDILQGIEGGEGAEVNKYYNEWALLEGAWLAGSRHHRKWGTQLRCNPPPPGV